jgi:hypothetical protein
MVILYNALRAICAQIKLNGKPMGVPEYGHQAQIFNPNGSTNQQAAGQGNNPTYPHVFLISPNVGRLLGSTRVEYNVEIKFIDLVGTQNRKDTNNRTEFEVLGELDQLAAAVMQGLRDYSANGSIFTIPENINLFREQGAVHSSNIAIVSASFLFAYPINCPDFRIDIASLSDYPPAQNAPDQLNPPNRQGVDTNLPITN